jgi:hypothetical protein
MDWLHMVAVVSLVAAAACATLIAFDLTKHPQHMWIMNIVWPLTALYSGVIALWAYHRIGRLSSKQSVEEPSGAEKKCPARKNLFRKASPWAPATAAAAARSAMFAPNG